MDTGDTRGRGPAFTHGRYFARAQIGKRNHIAAEIPARHTQHLGRLPAAIVKTYAGPALRRTPCIVDFHEAQTVRCHIGLPRLRDKAAPRSIRIQANTRPGFRYGIALQKEAATAERTAMIPARQFVPGRVAPVRMRQSGNHIAALLQMKRKIVQVHRLEQRTAPCRAAANTNAVDEKLVTAVCRRIDGRGRHTLIHLQTMPEINIAVGFFSQPRACHFKCSRGQIARPPNPFRPAIELRHGITRFPRLSRHPRRADHGRGLHDNPTREKPRPDRWHRRSHNAPWPEPAPSAFRMRPATAPAP